MAAEQRHSRRNFGENDRAGGHPNHEDASHESEITNPCSDECFVRCVGCGISEEPMTDQDIRSEPDQFPKDEKHYEIVRENDSEHREHEERQRCEITGL